MTRRSIQAGKTPTVIIKASMDVRVQGWDEERVLATTEHRWRLKIERGSASAIGHIRARAKVGDRVLFDLSTQVLKRKQKDMLDDEIQVQLGGAAVVRVPRNSLVKVYAGQSVEVRDLGGRVTVYAGQNVLVRNLRTVDSASAGRAMDLDCETLSSDESKFSAGDDLRFHVRDLNNATVMVDDLGGYWEAVVGDGHRRIRLKAGGEVILVTEQAVKGPSPDDVLGHVEPPPQRNADG